MPHNFLQLYKEENLTKGIFITATGTDVGKTYISGLIVKKLHNEGINCGYYKPALSGAEEINGELIPGDCAYVLKRAGMVAEPIDFVSYVFKQAVSPHLASEIENKPIKLEKIKEDFERIKQRFDYIVVEGAGGIICPFNLGEEKIMLPDVINELGLDIIIVADAGLGTINATVLTAEYARSHLIEVKGIILNNYDENDFMQRDNKKQIEELSGYKVITEVKHDQQQLGMSTEKLLSLFKEV